MASPWLPLGDPPPKSHRSYTLVRDLAVSFTRSGPKKYLHCWSKLPQDLLQMVFERLGFADFHLAKSVCSSWQSCSRQVVPNNQIPWLIMFPKNNNYCLLFNPEEKDKVYKTQNLSNDFAKSVCLATYRSWLLMHFHYGDMEDHQCNLCILDILTRERINLPAFVSENGFASSTFWIDEKTKDHLVLGMINEEYVISFTKGDNSWKQTRQLSDIGECFHMVYKDQKFYCLHDTKLKIFDFSRENPLQIFKINVRECVKKAVGLRVRLPGTLPSKFHWAHYKNNMVLTVGGDVLVVNSIRPSMSKIWKFEIYKMDSSNKGNKWEKILSLGDETILLELGITVLAKDIEGIKRNSIYFNGDYEDNDIFIFDLDTKMIEQPHQFVCSYVPCSNAQWFLPSFKRE